MAIIGYIRVNTTHQTTEKQRLAIHKYVSKSKLHVDQFIEVNVSSKKSEQERHINELLEAAKQGDTIIVTELNGAPRCLGLELILS